MNQPIYRRAFDTQEIVRACPAELFNRNKEVLFELSCPPSAQHDGQLICSRWRQMPLPDNMLREQASPSIEIHPGYFDYQPSDPEQCNWYLNFAHHDLFCCYGSPLFAQDEMQVAEHPALASLRHALEESNLDPLTVENDIATPILIMGVERRCAIATDANPQQDRPDGLYGNNFALASESAIRQATTLIDPPTKSNILAMEAPACGTGSYLGEEIEFILGTAYTGFRAAVQETQRQGNERSRTIIHTGYWGCGAYGGNRELMPLLQMIAACCANVDELVFHTGGDADGFHKSLQTLQTILPAGKTTPANTFLAQLVDQDYQWGVSDGN